MNSGIIIIIIIIDYRSDKVVPIPEAGDSLKYLTRWDSPPSATVMWKSLIWSWCTVGCSSNTKQPTSVLLIHVFLVKMYNRSVLDLSSVYSGNLFPSLFHPYFFINRSFFPAKLSKSWFYVFPFRGCVCVCVCFCMCVSKFAWKSVGKPQLSWYLTRCDPYHESVFYLISYQ